MPLINKNNANRFSGLNFDDDDPLRFINQEFSKEISGSITRGLIKRLIELEFYSNKDTKEKSGQN